MDNSGKWDSRGVFGALDQLDQNLTKYYELAGSTKIRDLTLGSTHVIKINSNTHVALLVAINKRNRFELNTDAFQECLSKLSHYAQEHECSVHFPQMKPIQENVYELDRIISKWFAKRFIPCFIYYFKRKEIV